MCIRDRSPTARGRARDRKVEAHPDEENSDVQREQRPERRLEIEDPRDSGGHRRAEHEPTDVERTLLPQILTDAFGVAGNHDTPNCRTHDATAETEERAGENELP